MIDQPKQIAILGAGSRGSGFAAQVSQYSHLGQIVAAAEPRLEYRHRIAETYHLPPDNLFERWQDFAARDRFCDAVIITTMDREHVGPALECLHKGYDLLIEKPMGVSLEECQAIEAMQRETGRIVAVCHSLRYQKGFRKVKEIIASGKIGRLMILNQLERVAWWHQGHSFVRGNWGNEDRSSFMLLAKSCHDIDYMAYVIDRPCLRVASFGHLSYFRPECAPFGAGMRCTECEIEPNCPYSAIKQYVLTNRTAWPASICSLDHSLEAHLDAIRTGPYGRCVWHCDNNVVDHQVVNMEFEGDVAATFTMTAFTQGEGRRVNAYGTEGELEFDQGVITVRTFADGNVERIELGRESGGHGGGDARIVREWLLALHTRDDSAIVANAQESLRTHSIVFAAEKSRREQRIVELSSLCGRKSPEDTEQK